VAIFRCNKCNHIKEVENHHIDKSIKCPKCDNPSLIYDTAMYVDVLIQKIIKQNNHLLKLQNIKSTDDTSSNNSLFDDEDMDIFNTKVMTKESYLKPIKEWFKKQNIKVNIDINANDTTGFFDEIAVRIGDNFDTFSFIINQIKYCQNKGYETVKLDLANKTPNEIKQIKSFSKELHEYSFVSRYNFIKKDNLIYLNLQTAPNIRNFFDGGWMEWFVFVKLLELAHKKNIDLKCTKNLKIQFQDDISNELDIFTLLNGSPIYIECKTGEFRQDIDKYLKLRKKLHLKKEQFILCIFGLDIKQAQGLTSMYDLTFVNETTLLQSIF
jgi:hypothetical protein